MQSRHEDLQTLVQQIVDLVHPLRVVLFGSAVRGDAGADSDLDVLVVMPEGTHRWHTMQLLYANIRGVDASFDTIVATPSTLEKHKDNVGLIYRAILREGRTLYAA